MIKDRQREDPSPMQLLTPLLPRSAPRVLAVSLLAAFGWACSAGKAAPLPPAATVAVIDVGKQDVPIRTEWVTTLDGYVTARTRARVTGSLGQPDPGPAPTGRT